MTEPVPTKRNALLVFEARRFMAVPNHTTRTKAPSASSCGSPKSCPALKSRAYGGSFLLGAMLHLSDAQYHAALSGHHCPSVLRSSQPPTRKSRPATTTRSL